MSICNVRLKHSYLDAKQLAECALDVIKLLKGSAGCAMRQGLMQLHLPSSRVRVGT